MKSARLMTEPQSSKPSLPVEIAREHHSGGSVKAARASSFLAGPEPAVRA